MNAELLATAKALPLPERIELAEALWESVTQEGYEPPLTPGQAAELDRRLEEHRRDPRQTFTRSSVVPCVQPNSCRDSDPWRLRVLASWRLCVNTGDLPGPRPEGKPLDEQTPANARGGIGIEPATRKQFAEDPE